MFALGGNTFPRSQEEFARSFEEGLEIFGSVPGIKGMSGGTFPDIARLEVDLSGGSAGRRARVSVRSGTTRPGVRIHELSVRAKPLRLSESHVDFLLEARNVAFDYDRDAEERPILTPTFVESGRITASTSKSHFESLVLALVRKSAARHEITIESVSISLSACGPRDLGFTALITAQKMIFTAKINATGRIHLDDQLTAHISELDCTGDGIVGAGAAELLKPYLLKINGKSFPLAALSLGSAQVRNVEIRPDDPIRFDADFGG